MIAQIGSRRCCGGFTAVAAERAAFAVDWIKSRKPEFTPCEAGRKKSQPPYVPYVLKTPCTNLSSRPVDYLAARAQWAGCLQAVAAILPPGLGARACYAHM